MAGIIIVGVGALTPYIVLADGEKADGTLTYVPRGSWRENSKGEWYGDTSGWYAKNETIKIDGKTYTMRMGIRSNAKCSNDRGPIPQNAVSGPFLVDSIARRWYHYSIRSGSRRMI
ncbi:MAG: hypothetical protein IKN24_07295 [Lachnospiraceae bacterium]|nr:hypothetical protein [Lachnospiraceae bacterium]